MKWLCTSFLLVLFLWIISTPAFGQEAFLGKYKGDLEIYSKSGFQKVDMEFHLLKTEVKDHYSYVLIYDNVPRNYTLIAVDRSTGEFLLDENNGIVLPTTLKNGVFYSQFEVQGNLLTSRLELHKDQLFFEIIFSNMEKKQISGKTDEVPKVIGYPVSTVQKAILTRF